MNEKRKWTVVGIGLGIAASLLFGLLPGFAGASWWIPAVFTAVVAWFAIRNVCSEERGAFVEGGVCVVWFAATWALYFAPRWLGVMA